MEQMPGLEVFLLGLTGGIAPEALRLYSLRTRANEFRWSWAYILLSMPFWLVSGVVAVVLPAVTTWGAFYAGLSAPVVITTALKQAANVRQRRRGRIRPLAVEDQRSGVDAFIRAL
jgi:hypothetical protein